MAEAVPGPGAEGQPAALNPQARADIDVAFKKAGVEAVVDYQAKREIDSALANAGAEHLKGSSPPPMETPSRVTPKGDLSNRFRIVNKGALPEPEDGQVMGGLADPSNRETFRTNNYKALKKFHDWMQGSRGISWKPMSDAEFEDGVEMLIKEFHDWMQRKTVSSDTAGGLADPSLGEKPTNDAEVVGGLAIEGMENDPKIETIKQELTGAWELLHGSRYDKDGVLRGDYQDFLFGNPADARAGKKTLSLDDRAKQVFRERFSDDARAYDEREKVRIYDDLNQDPALKAVETEISRRTNTDSEVAQARAHYGEVWNKVYGLHSMNAWRNFATDYPEKATGYKDKFPPIQQVFEGQERLRQYQEEQTQSVSNRSQGLEGNGTNQPGVPGGLSLPPDIGTTTQEAAPANAPKPQQEQPQQFDPTALLSAESMSVDDFYGLNGEQVYNSLRGIAATHHDENIRRKAQKILDLTEFGKDNFLKNNPGATSIDFTK